MDRQQGINRELLKIAIAQHGLFTSEQAATAIPKRALHNGLENGDFERLHRGVYRIVPFERNDIQRIHAAVLAASEYALASYWSAALLHGFTSQLIKSQVEITIPSNRCLKREGIRIYRERYCSGEKQNKINSLHSNVEGIPVTSKAQTLIDLSAKMSMPRLIILARKVFIADPSVALRLTALGERPDVMRKHSARFLLAFSRRWSAVSGNRKWGRRGTPIS